jgi:c-di-GMP-binding flagellar brake protein YcgR
MTQSDHKTLFETYSLKGKGEILEKLRMMEKYKILLTAVPAGENNGFLTTIVKVIPEKGMVALDVSANASLNKQVSGAEGITFSAQVDGIVARFAADRCVEATLNGQSVFAIPIPQSLYWLQRRRCYRVAIPYSKSVKCHVPLASGQIAEFSVLNVSLFGLALMDRMGHFTGGVEVGDVFVSCKLDLPGFADERFALEVRNKLETAADAHHTGLRVGCAFRGQSRNFEIQMQKLMYELEIQKKQSENLTKP